MALASINISHRHFNFAMMTSVTQRTFTEPAGDGITDRGGFLTSKSLASWNVINEKGYVSLCYVFGGRRKTGD